MVKSYSTLVCLFLLLCIPSHAQRTMKGQPFAGAAFLWGGAPSGEIRAGQYQSSFLWDAALRASSFCKTLSTDDSLDCLDITLAGSWQWRILSDRSRIANLYAGAGVFAGYEVLDPLNRLPETVDLGFKKGSIIYGVQPCVSMEVFFCRRVALVISSSALLTFNSPLGVFRWDVSAGIRLDL